MAIRPPPISPELVNRHVRALGLPDIASASIREVKRIADLVEKESGVQFIRMEMGVPGLPAFQSGSTRRSVRSNPASPRSIPTSRASLLSRRRSPASCSSF